MRKCWLGRPQAHVHHVDNTLMPQAAGCWLELGLLAPLLCRASVTGCLALPVHATPCQAASWPDWTDRHRRQARTSRDAPMRVGCQHNNELHPRTSGAAAPPDSSS